MRGTRDRERVQYGFSAERNELSHQLLPNRPWKSRSPEISKVSGLGQRAASEVSGSNDTWTTMVTEHVDPDLLILEIEMIRHDRTRRQRNETPS